MPLILAATTHDPDRRFIPLLERLLPALKERFTGIVVTASPHTHEDTVRFLSEAGCLVEKLTTNEIGTSYRTGISLAGRQGDVFSCDLDRILHWVKFHPSELDSIISSLPAKSWVVFARTKRAYATHQTPLIHTEAVFNELFAALTELPFSDFLSSAFFLKKEYVTILNSQANSTGVEWYGECPMILYRAGLRPGMMECEGLEWETPDRFADEIAAEGFESWRKRFEGVDEWRYRTAYLHAFLRGAVDAWRRINNSL